MAEAYNHQANGSAEHAGQALQRCLKEFHSQQKINWVEAFPQSLRIMRDMPRVDASAFTALLLVVIALWGASRVWNVFN